MILIAVFLFFFFFYQLTILNVCLLKQKRNLRDEDIKKILLSFRNDEKTAQDYKVQGGSVLHLVLALRGGL